MSPKYRRGKQQFALYLFFCVKRLEQGLKVKNMTMTDVWIHTCGLCMNTCAWKSSVTIQQKQVTVSELLTFHFHGTPAGRSAPRSFTDLSTRFPAAATVCTTLFGGLLVVPIHPYPLSFPLSGRANIACFADQSVVSAVRKRFARAYFCHLELRPWALLSSNLTHVIRGCKDVALASQGALTRRGGDLSIMHCVVRL